VLEIQHEYDQKIRSRIVREVTMNAFPYISFMSFLVISNAQSQPGFAGIAWWIWLLILIIIILLVWWLITRQVKHSPSIDETPHRNDQQPTKVTEMPIPIQVEVPQSLATETDNLEIIEGIGPKIATILQSAGINTFAQLGRAEQSKLLEILYRAGLRVNDPTTWPEQARLAAVGDWEGLKQLQETLKGGRRV
jgi:predicted flap endonuclease-1-like 5' DNA nuclease